MLLKMKGLILAIFVVIFETINCGPAGWIDSGDAKTKLASLLTSSNEDISANNKASFEPANYEPFYKSKYQSHNPQEELDSYQPNTQNLNRNGKFAIPWLEISEEPQESDSNAYESSFEESRRQHYLNHKHRFHQGLWFHHPHPDCFPFGNHRRPRPPVPPTTVAPSIDPRASTSAGFIRPHPPQMPLVPTTSTEAAGIDIRLGTDDDNNAERIIFPDD